MPQLNLGPNFYNALTKLANKYNLTPEDLLLVFYNETRLQSDAGHGQNGAAGLSQIISFNLPKIGWTQGPEAFSKLSAEEQLPYIERMFDSTFKAFGMPKDATYLHILNFVPASMLLPEVKSGSDDAVLVENFMITKGYLPEHGTYYGYAKVSPADEVRIYNSNRGLDYNKDGKITVGDMRNNLERLRSSAEFQNILRELQENSSETNIPPECEQNISNPPPQCQQNISNMPKQRLPNPTNTFSSDSIPSIDSMQSAFKAAASDYDQYYSSRIVKIAYIRKLPNGKYRVFSEKGKNMGTYNSRSGAKNRLRQIEYFKHNADDGLFEIDLSDIDDLSYSAIMRKLNENNEKDFMNDFVRLYKEIFDEMYSNDKVNEEICLKIVIERLKEKYDIKLPIIKQAQYDDPINTARILGNMVLFLMGRIKPENRKRVLENMINKINYLNESELSSKNLPGGAAIGNAITLIKTTLMGKSPQFIRNVLNAMTQHLRANNA
jgi:hypothetical protein